jgi:hypothetical protein
MICSWLLFSGQVSTAKEALELFSQRRTSDEPYARGLREGPKVPSQLRIIHSFDQLLKLMAGPNPTDFEVQRCGGRGGGGGGGKAVKNVCLHPIQRLSKVAGEGGFIRVNISDKSKQVLASQSCPVSADMLEVMYILQNTHTYIRVHICTRAHIHTHTITCCAYSFVYTYGHACMNECLF